MHLVLPADTAVPALLTLCCAFAVRSCAAFVLCWALARLATSAALRFAVWLAYLVGVASYWAWCLTEVYRVLFPSMEMSSGSGGTASRRALMLTHGEAHATAAVLFGAGVFYVVAEAMLTGLALRRQLLLRRALNQRIAAPESLESICRQMIRDAGAPASEVWLLPALSSAASAGWLRPAIYLPVDAPEASLDEMRDVLRHEIFHVWRRDGLWDAMSRLCQRTLFFHPLTAYALRALRLNRELASDRLVVLHSSSTPDAYAQTLVRFGWRAVPSPEEDLFGIQFAARSSVLKMRVRAILEGEHVNSKPAKAVRALAGGGTCWGVCLLLPLLSISFALPSVRLAAFGPTPAAVPVRRTHRKSRTPQRTLVSAPAAVSSGPSPVVVAAAGRTIPVLPRYQMLPGPTAPMWDATAETDDDFHPAGRDASGPGIAGGPKAPERSLTNEVALGLSRLASHDHDRDDDH